MKAFKSMAISFALVVAGAILVPSVQAQSTFHRITHVTLSGPVQIPGKVLPAGEYVFQLDVLPSNETSIVEIRDKTGEKVISTLLTIPDYRLTPTGKTVILFRERAAGSPAALRAWFYPGENYGHEFAYPMREAKQIANANHQNVPAVADNTSDNDLKSAQVTEAKPEGNAQASNQTTTNNEASAHQYQLRDQRFGQQQRAGTRATPVSESAGFQDPKQSTWLPATNPCQRPRVRFS